MSPPTSLNHSKSLDGVHGIHVVPHSPFAVEEITQNEEFPRSTFCKSSRISMNQQILMQVWQQRPAFLRPIQCSLHGDEGLAETVANVLTSLPFIALGMQAPRKNLNTKLYANSLIGVGVASTLYHSSRGRLRRFLRWADYTMIATTTVASDRLDPIITHQLFKSRSFSIFVSFSSASALLCSPGFDRIYLLLCFPQCLSRALRSQNPKFLMAASAVFLPIQPLMVSAVHTGMMEVAFAKRALEDPELRMAHTVHKMSSLVGGVLFIADDVFPQTPFLHAAWHLAAAVGVGTCNKLLE